MVNPGEHGKNKNLLLEDDMVFWLAKCRGNQQLKACRRQAQWQEALCLFHRFRAGGRVFSGEICLGLHRENGHHGLKHGHVTCCNEVNNGEKWEENHYSICGPMWLP